MPRIVKNHKIERDNRDKGKIFVITEMSPRKGHDWATRAIFGLLNNGVNIPDNVAQQGLAGLASMGIGSLSNLPHAVAGPLLNELFDCVQIQQERVTRALVEEDIEEIVTLFELQREVLTLHIAPFISGGSPTTA